MHKNRVALISLSVIFLMMSPSTNGATVHEELIRDLFVYYDFEKGASISFIPTSSSFSVGDASVSMSFCKSDEKYYCFNNTDFSFYLDKNVHLTKGIFWVVNDIKYSIISDKKTIDVFGRKWDTVLIESRRSGYVYNYYWSSKIGLIGIGVVEEKSNKGSLYLLKGNIGLFGGKM